MSEIQIIDRAKVLSRGRWVRETMFTYGGEPTVPMNCIVCKSSLRGDRVVLVDAGSIKQKPIFMCNDGLICSGRLHKRQLSTRPQPRTGHKVLRLRFRIRSTKLDKQRAKRITNERN